jgi:DAK2 domain
MDDNRQVDVPTLLQSIAGQLANSQEGIDQASSSTHGRRMAQAFSAAAEAAKEAGTDDAGAQLQRAAAALRQRGQGRAVSYYADGLEQAATQVRGQKGISLSGLLPFLQSFVGGVQSNNPAQPGQGTMIDALVPALGALSGAQSTGNTQGGILDALGAAVSGAQGTTQGGQMDPGAASAVNVIGGIIAALAPSLIGSLLGGQQQGASGSSGGMGGLGGLLGGSQQGGGLGGLLGGSQQQSGYGAPQGSADPFGGLGGLLGGLLGGQQQGAGGGSGGILGGGIPDLGGGGTTAGGYGRPAGARDAGLDSGEDQGATSLGDLLDDLRGGSDDDRRGR